MKRKRVKSRPSTSDHSTMIIRAVEARRPAPCPIVAIGASAGGLELFQQFFDQMPPDSGLAFVLIQHLDPNHQTLMPELLAKHTRMPITLVSGSVPVEPDHVYVSAPQIALSGRDGVLHVGNPSADRLPIDHFFRSLAEDQGDNVVAIILSGTGADGTLGLKAVKEHGGMTIAQSIETAKYESMPRSAIASGSVDHVLPIKQIPGRILEYIVHLRKARGREGTASLQGEIAEGLPKIFPILRRRTGHDFSRYKESTLVRRVQRRMQILYIDGMARYIAEIQQNPKELDNLFKDLLIGVTQFFRDPEVFDALARVVLPDLFRAKHAENQIRVWVPGCASGEEAYSIAILLAEHAASRSEAGQTVPQIQIFGTDLDDRALDVARKGFYSDVIAEHISPGRLERFFVKRGVAYELIPEVREMCIFSPHSLIKDPPFSRQDLISCRNLLIYLEADLQRKLLPVFHYALNPSGYLLLGPSENVASRTELFRTIDKKQRIFQRLPSLLRHSVEIPIVERGRVTRLQPATPAITSPSREQNVVRTIERVVLEDYAPASVIINEQGEIIYFSGHTSKFLEAPAGVPNNQIMNMVRRGLRLELRTAFHRALSTREEVIRPHVLVRIGEEKQPINLIVRPLVELGRDAGLFIVVFQELVVESKSGRSRGRRRTESRQVKGSEGAVTEPLIVQQLENELRTTKEDLQTTIEELETSNEELKSANEELLSMNEELQSTNEELQTSKEELQSLNDELQRKIEELDLAHTDLQNFFQSTQVATVFVSPDLRIKKFTPAIQQLFHLQDRDIGRHLLDAAPDLAPGEIAADIAAVLETLAPRERQIPLAGGRSWYMARIVPYRALDQSIHGAVVTFTDVTDLKLYQLSRAELAAIVEGSHDGIIGKSLDGTITSWNSGAERMYGYTADEAIGRPIAMVTAPEKQEELHRLFEQVASGESIESFETTRITKDGRRLTISLTLSPIHDPQGRIVGISGIDRDISERIASERHRAELAAIVESSHDGIIGKSLEGTITSWNKGAERMYGYTAAEAIGRPIALIVPPERQAEIKELFEKVGHGERIDSFETIRLTKDGRRLTISLTLSPIHDSDGHIVGISGFDRDITERNSAQKALADAQDRLSRYAEELEAQVAERTQVLKDTIQSLEGVCYTIAHDLRAPLRTLQGFTRILLDDYSSAFDDEGRLLSERIVAAATRMDALIHDLLEFAKLSHLELPLAPLNLNFQVEQVLAHMAAEIEATKAEILVRPLPRVIGNQIVLNQVLTNLIGNALKFTRPQTHPRIEIWSEVIDRHARIFIKDNGIGIEPIHHERIFGLFQKLHKPEDYPGTGIGLAIVRKAMDRMGGSVGLHSTPGEGSCFFIDLRLGSTTEL